MKTQYSKPNIQNELPNDIFMEILARLPVKSILRFKSVSKDWFHLFTYNLTFRQLYKARAYSREGGVIHVIPPSNIVHFRHRPDQWDRRMFAIDMKKPPNARAKVYEPSLVPFDVDTKSNIIDGLICFYNRHNDRGSLYVYNIFTREVLHLPRPKEAYIIRRCFIGYDPNNMEYKVVRIFSMKDSTTPAECQVFTLDNNENKPRRNNEYWFGWRSIDISYMESDYFTSRNERWLVHEPGFCLSGFLYWTSEIDLRSKEKVILMFDVEKEEFKVISYPKEIIGYLAYIEGCLSRVNYVKKMEDNVICLEITWWKIMDLKDKNKLLFTNTVVNVPFPSILDKYPCIRYNHLGHVFILRMQLMNKQYIVDCYDINTGKYKELEVNNAQGMLNQGYAFKPYLVVENIVPLKRMRT